MDHLLELLGRLHPLLVHLPIGILVVAILFEFMVLIKRFKDIHSALPLLWGGGFIGAILSCIAGYLLKQSGGYDSAVIDMHQNTAMVLTIAAGLVFVTKALQRWIILQKMLVALSGVMLMVAGHMGGNLTHGEDYLTQPLAALTGHAESTKTSTKFASDPNQALVYEDWIEPVLEKKCMQCHNASKQKGGLRLDTPDFISQGGENGAVILTDNPAQSPLLQCLLLPEADDKHMPPKGKPQLTEKEITLIRWWIAETKANFKIKVAEVNQNQPPVQFLTTAQGENVSEEAEPKPDDEMPQTKLTAPKSELLGQLKNKGIVVTALNPENTCFAVNLVNAQAFNDHDFEALTALAPNIVWLDMSDTKITDRTLAKIGTCKQLTRLSLDHTNITDAGLIQLATLPNLRRLNLYGTAVGDKGLSNLLPCPKLEKLYLWQTRVSTKGVQAFRQKANPIIEINTGTENQSTSN